MADAKFDEAEFLRTLEKVAADKDVADWSNPAPRFDPQLAKDVRDEKLRGAKIERYVKALDGHGFQWVPPKALGLWNNGAPHQEGMWIHPDYELQLAFTSDDVLQLFPGATGPEDLWRWVTDKKQRLAAIRAGLVLPG